MVETGEIEVSYVSPLNIEIGSALNHLCSDPHDGQISLRPCAYSTTGFKGLKAMKFVDVQVAGQILECFMSNCPLLERLSMRYSKKLEKLRVVGPSIALKYLDIHMCSKIRDIEIYDSNLVSLSYGGHKLVLRNLEVLKMRPPKLNKKNFVSPMLVNLRHLELSFEVDDVCCVPQLASFILDSPCLHELVLKLQHFYVSNRREGIEIKQAEKYSHRYLKIVEVEECFGRSSDFELAIYLIENAIDLEKLVLQGSVVYSHSRKHIEEVKRHARLKLEGRVPTTTKLV